MINTSRPPEPEDGMVIHLRRVDQGLNRDPQDPAGTVVTVYNLNGPIAKRMIDLQLHKFDLNFVGECLNLLAHRHVTHSIESEALWNAAMVRFFKCFGGTLGGRSQLSAKRVFRGEPAAAMISFNLLEALRNKTVVHDQNSFMQGKLGVPIAFPPNAHPRMGPLVYLNFVGTTLDDENVSNLTLLTRAAIQWIDTEYSEKERQLVEQLKMEKVEEIVARGELTWTSPSYETASKTK